VELFVEFFDLLMGLRLDPGHVIPWAFEMGDDLIELHVKGRGVSVLRVLEDEDHQQGCDADRDVGPIDPEAINPITTSRVAAKSAHGVPIHFDRTDAIEANRSESCRFMRTSSPPISA
jgi:hypothetical protein